MLLGIPWHLLYGFAIQYGAQHSDDSLSHSANAGKRLRSIEASPALYISPTWRAAVQKSRAALMFSAEFLSPLNQGNVAAVIADVPLSKFHIRICYKESISST